MAVQGGLLAATLAQREEEKLEEKAKGGNAVPILAFLAAKLTAYTILGFFLGLLGSFFSLSIQLRAGLQIAVAVFMVGTALNILNVHPIFRYFVIQPPKFLTRLVRKQTKSTHFANASRVEQDIFAPAILGAFTIFIPCGTTQAMMALAVASGKPLLGAAILFAFILGTSPVFFILGYFATKLGDIFEKQFMKLAAFAIIILAIFNANNASALLGSSITLENIGGKIWCTISWCKNQSNTNAMLNSPTIEIQSAGYYPKEFTVKAGSQVSLKLKNINGAGCVQAFTIPSLGIQKIVPVGTSDTIAFTAPNQTQDIPFMCSMGMYRGIIHVEG